MRRSVAVFSDQFLFGIIKYFVLAVVMFSVCHRCLDAFGFVLFCHKNIYLCICLFINLSICLVRVSVSVCGVAGEVMKGKKCIFVLLRLMIYDKRL